MKTYTGGCHCGNVRYEIEAEIDKVMQCNCSICHKKGHLLTFVTADKFHLKKGEDAVTDYLFNKKHIHHMFCSTCGVGSFSRGIRPDGVPMVAINVRCLDDVDVFAFPVKHVDGKNY